MAKRESLLPRLFLSGTLVPVLLLIAFLFWFLGSTAGAQWLLGEIPGLRTGPVEGSFWTGISVHQLEYQHGRTRIHAGFCGWKIHPLDLLVGKIALSGFRLQNADIFLPAPPPGTSPFTLRWPDLPLWTRMFSLEIAEASLTKVTFIQRQRPAVHLDKVRWKMVAWQHGQIEISGLSARTSQGEGVLTAQASWWTRSVQLHARWTMEPANRTATMALNWKAMPQEGYGGTTAVTWSSAQETLALHTLADISPYALRLSDIRLQAPPLKKTALGNLTVLLPAHKGDRYRLSSSWTGLVPPGLPGGLARKPLSLQIGGTGTLAHYSGHVTLGTTSSANQIEGQFNGTGKGLKAELHGQIFSGSLLPSSLRLDWRTGRIAAQGRIAARNIPVSLIYRGIPGQVSADAVFTAAQQQKRWSGDLQVTLLHSLLYHQPLEGKIDAVFGNRGWNLQNAVFTGPGLRARAQGSLRRGLDFRSTVSNWQGILPSARGSTHLAGQVRQGSSGWTGYLTFRGTRLQYRGFSINRVRLDAALQGNRSLDAQLSARKIAISGLKFGLQVQVLGQLGHPQFQLTAVQQRNVLSLSGQALRGPGLWSAAIQQLSLKTAKYGPWTMEKPASAIWRGGALSIKGFRIRGPGSARLHFGGSYAPRSRSATVQFHVRSLPLDFHDQALNAGIQGLWNIRLDGQCQGICSLESQWDASGLALVWHMAHEQKHLAIPQFSGNMAWTASGLAGQSLTRISGNLGQLSLQFSSPAKLRLPWKFPSSAPLHVRLKGSLPGQLFARLPTGNLHIDPQGAIDLTLGLTGTLGSPQWQGQADFSNLGLYIPQAGLHVQDLHGHVTGKGSQLVLEDLGARSGGGNLQATGTLHWHHGYQFQAHVTGSRFLAINLPQVQAAVNPNLQVTGTAGSVHISGTIQTSRLRILGTDFGGAQPSGDVVFVKNVHRPPTSTALSADIRVSLGRDSRVLIGGLHAGLAGSLHMLLRPGGQPMLHGTLRMVNGKYQIYGNTLHFERGNIHFSGPPNAASLDVLALRTIKPTDSFAVDNQPVKAGVDVTGTLSHPNVSLYSIPSMPQNDIFSYLVLGTSSSGLQSQSSLLSAAAGQLFSAGRAAVFGQGLNSTGIDFGVSSNGQSGLSNDMVRLGRYITPNLYFSVGQAIIGQGTIARLRYRISRHIEIQTEGGTQNGANLFYRIDF